VSEWIVLALLTGLSIVLWRLAGNTQVLKRRSDCSAPSRMLMQPRLRL
jgi:hypothetical protein